MSKRKVKQRSTTVHQFQYIPVLLYLILSLFAFDTKVLLMGAGVLTLGSTYFILRSTSKVTVLGLAAHTFLLFGGFAALTNVTPILLIYGSFQEAALFFFVVLLSFVLLWRNKDRFGLLNQYILVASIVFFLLLLFISDLVGTILAIVFFIVLWVIETHTKPRTPQKPHGPLKKKRKHN